jgi:hypothetical protein
MRGRTGGRLRLADALPTLPTSMPTSMQERFERAVALPADIPAHLRGPAKTEEE